MIHIEQKANVLVVRGGPDFKKFGDPYEFSMIIEVEGTHVEISALSGKFSTESFSELKKRLKELGFKTASWERRKNDKIKKVTTEG